MFPDFRPDKVLRFSRLFGPGKHNSLPHTWKNVKKRRRKRKEKLLEEQNADSSGLFDLTNPGSSCYLTPGGESSERHNEILDGEDESPDLSLCVPDAEVIKFQN